LLAAARRGLHFRLLIASLNPFTPSQEMLLARMGAVLAAQRAVAKRKPSATYAFRAALADLAAVAEGLTNPRGLQATAPALNLEEGHAVAFYKDQTGVVHLKGYETLGTASQAIFQLPPGDKPAADDERPFAVACVCPGLSTGVMSIGNRRRGVPPGVGDSHLSQRGRLPGRILKPREAHDSAPAG
jgi:hypothetical protein